MSDSENVTQKQAWFGRRPPAGVTVAWAARCIYSWTGGFYGSRRASVYRKMPHLDTLYDRQSFLGEPKEVEPICEWFNRSGRSKLLSALGEENLGINEDRAIFVHDNEFVIEACPNASHGYLYIVVYRRQEAIEKQETTCEDGSCSICKQGEPCQ